MSQWCHFGHWGSLSTSRGARGALCTMALLWLVHVRSVGLGKDRLVLEDQWLAGSILEVLLEWCEKRDCSQDPEASATGCREGPIPS